MSQSFDATRSLIAFDQDTTLIVVVEMSQSKPLKKLDADPEALLTLLHRWRNEAEQSGQPIKRITVAYEADATLLVGGLVAGASRRGSCNPSLERCGVARTPARQDGSP